MARLSVIAVSDAFCEFWSDLATDLCVGIDQHAAGDAAVSSPATAAVIVAAGGAEREAARWLERRRVPAGTPLFVVGTDPGRRTAMELVLRGATDYFAFPDDLEIFRSAVASLADGGRDRKSIGSRVLRSANGHMFPGIIGRSEAMLAALERAARLLPHRNASALIVGETGSGKELLARAIHQGGPRHAAPFVAINCSALPENLIESELFGHERGSFTDAHAAKAGLFEVAERGTLFLDEIADLPIGLQAKLLRVLEDKEIRRVGGTKSRIVDVRVLAATNKNLAEMVRQGKFREDLYFRLSTVVLGLPPLRDRGEDLFLLAEALLERLAAEHDLPVPMLTLEVRRRLAIHTWPGNVRELKNAVERALLLSPPGELNADELLFSPLAQKRTDGPIPFPAPLEKITRAAVEATVELCGGNRTESARRLLISPRRLRRLLSGVGT